MPLYYNILYLLLSVNFILIAIYSLLVLVIQSSNIHRFLQEAEMLHV
jgi:hypothetical protein